MKKDKVYYDSFGNSSEDEDTTQLKEEKIIKEVLAENLDGKFGEAIISSYNKGRKQTLFEVEKLIDELKVRKILDRGMNILSKEYYIEVEELKSKLKEMK